MGIKIVYQGPNPIEDVEIVETGQVATPGVPIEVVTDVAERLLEQATWHRAAAKKAATRKPRKATKKVAPASAPADPDVAATPEGSDA